jgi:anti-anti-sigma factor
MLEMKSYIIGEIAHLSLTGRFDAHETAAVSAFLSNQAASKLVLDMTGVFFVDSAALAVLIRAMWRCQHRGGALVLYSLQPSVNVIFELTRLDHVLRIAGTEKEAFDWVA